MQLEAEYRAPVEHHNPMEPFATTVVRDENGRLTVYDKTQGVQNVGNYLCNVFGYSKRAARRLAIRRWRVRPGLRPCTGIFGRLGRAGVEALGPGVATPASRCSALRTVPPPGSA